MTLGQLQFVQYEFVLKLNKATQSANVYSQDISLFSEN